MREPSDKRKRTLALQNRALNFSVGVTRCYPGGRLDPPSETVWENLLRAADSVSNNLVEADDASSPADFIHKMKLTLRETKESKVGLAKIRLAGLAGHERCAALQLEGEAGELAAIFAAIVNNTSRRLEREQRERRRKEM